MITKEQFINFITSFQEFQSAIERFEKALGGDKISSSVCLFECDWYQAVDKMLGEFVIIHLTEVGGDLLYAYLFEDSVLTIYENKEDKIGKELDTLEKLYDYLITNDLCLKD